MAILTYPLNGILYDAEDVETYLCTRTSGVFASDGHFPASLSGSRDIAIGPGLAWMQNEEFHGKAIYNPEEIVVSISEADPYQTRIDRIVLRYDKLLNMTQLLVKEGTPASSPKAPDIERDSLVYELGIYTVNVRPSVISLSEADISNTFLDESVCGIMEDAVTSIPTQELYDQWYAWFADVQTDTEAFEEQFNVWFHDIQVQATQYMEENEREFEEWRDTQKRDYDEWFDNLQYVLDGDVAGHLELEIEYAQDTADEALEQLATGWVTGWLTDGEGNPLLAEDDNEDYFITISRPICNCDEMESSTVGVVSDEFDSHKSYSAGEYCIYDNKLYKFTEVKLPGGFDYSVVETCTVTEELEKKQDELEDSGWVNLSLNSGFVSYASDQVPMYRKVGKLVQVMGAVAPSSSISASTTEYTIANLPNGYRPHNRITLIFQGSSYNKWMGVIYPNGDIKFGRYGGTSGATVSTSNWLPFSFTYLTD